MIKLTLTLALLPVACATQATCLTGRPEIGDIGLRSQLVCAELERRFPEARLAVDGRAIHTPNAVSVDVTVDGQPMELRYGLSGYRWRLDRTGADVVEVRALKARVVMDKYLLPTRGGEGPFLALPAKNGVRPSVASGLYPAEESVVIGGDLVGLGSRLCAFRRRSSSPLAVTGLGTERSVSGGF